MKFTIITVCRNAADNLSGTIESVLSQSYHDIEYIVIDGGSTDGTIDIIHKYAPQLAYWESKPDKGIYDAMNKGVDKSHGDYILFLNAGDLFFNNDVLAEVASIIGTGSHPDVLYGETVGKNARGYFRLKINPQPFKDDIGCCHQSIFVNGDIMRTERFNTRYRLRADFDLLHRLYLDKRYTFRHIHRYISIYDFFGASSSVRYQRTMRQEQLNILGEKFTYPAFLIWLAKYMVHHFKTELLPLGFRKLFSELPEIMTLNEIKQFED